MHRPLVAACLIATSAMVAYAAVPLGVSSRRSIPAGQVVGRGDSSFVQSTAARAPSVPSTAAIAGEVRDAQGTALAGAVVEASHAGSGWHALTLTDREGRFRFQRVPVGQITLVVRRGDLEHTQVVDAGARA